MQARAKVAAAITDLLRSTTGSATIVFASGGVSQVFHVGPMSGPQPATLPGKPADPLPDIKANILEAVGKRHLSARQIADAAGYRLGSYFRGILAQMRREKLLAHDDEGYYNARAG